MSISRHLEFSCIVPPKPQTLDYCELAVSDGGQCVSLQLSDEDPSEDGLCVIIRSWSSAPSCHPEMRAMLGKKVTVIVAVED